MDEMERRCVALLIRRARGCDPAVPYALPYRAAVYGDPGDGRAVFEFGRRDGTEEPAVVLFASGAISKNARLLRAWARAGTSGSMDWCDSDLAFGFLRVLAAFCRVAPERMRFAHTVLDRDPPEVLQEAMDAAGSASDPWSRELWNVVLGNDSFDEGVVQDPDHLGVTRTLKRLVEQALGDSSAREEPCDAKVFFGRRGATLVQLYPEDIDESINVAFTLDHSEDGVDAIEKAVDPQRSCDNDLLEATDVGRFRELQQLHSALTYEMNVPPHQIPHWNRVSYVVHSRELIERLAATDTEHVETSGPELLAALSAGLHDRVAANSTSSGESFEDVLEGIEAEDLEWEGRMPFRALALDVLSGGPTMNTERQPEPDSFEIWALRGSDVATGIVRFLGDDGIVAAFYVGVVSESECSRIQVLWNDLVRRRVSGRAVRRTMRDLYQLGAREGFERIGIALGDALQPGSHELSGVLMGANSEADVFQAERIARLDPEFVSEYDEDELVGDTEDEDDGLDDLRDAIREQIAATASAVLAGATGPGTEVGTPEFLWHLHERSVVGMWHKSPRTGVPGIIARLDSRGSLPQIFAVEDLAGIARAHGALGGRRSRKTVYDRVKVCDANERTDALMLLQMTMFGDGVIAFIDSEGTQFVEFPVHPGFAAEAMRVARRRSL